MTKRDLEHLEWLYWRFVNVYDENPNIDYMLGFRRIIDAQSIPAKPSRLELITNGDFDEDVLGWIGKDNIVIPRTNGFKELIHYSIHPAHRTGWAGVWDALKSAVTGDYRQTYPCKMRFSVMVRDSDTVKIYGTQIGEVSDETP